MTLNFSNPEGHPKVANDAAENFGPNDVEVVNDDDAYFEQMGEFVENNQERCPIALVIDVSGSMRDEMDMLNVAIEKFRNTVMKDELASLRVEVAVVTFNHKTEVRQQFSCIDEFYPGELEASGGTKMCHAVNTAMDMLEQRKQVYRDNGIIYYRPWMFILTDGMTSDVDELAETSQRVKNAEQANGVMTFAILAGEARYDGAMRQMKQITNRVLPMKDAAYDELMEWIANSTVASSNSVVGDKVRMAEGIDLWMEADTSTD